MKLKDGQTIVFFGDSITRGNVGSNYITALKRLLSEYSTSNNFHFINAGRDGDMVEDLLQRVENDVLSLGPDWVVVLAGINDVFYESILMEDMPMDNPMREPSIHRRMVEHFTDNYSSLIDILKDQVQNLAICTTTAVEGSMNLGITESLTPINDAIRSISYEKNCELIDLDFAIKENLAEMKKEGCYAEFSLTVDGVHLNERGARLVAKMMFEFFTRD
ncbi:MAG: hypothetical protein IBX64_00940 [Actinobacteria bacterium]|nr:hypothetical protein [Actinomycetota bacterium]